MKQGYFPQEIEKRWQEYWEKNKTFKYICLNCNKEFYIQLCEYRKSKNHFCSKSCSAIYNNANKKYGTKVSKLEKFIQKHIIKKYKDLTILFNNKTAIKSELDIYIPSLKIAFELNGIVHYKPIYGDKKYKNIIDNDRLKNEKCKDCGIELFTINTSS